MAKVSQQYIVIEDCVGYIDERGLSTKQQQTKLLRGELLRALPETGQPKDSSKIVLVRIDDLKPLRVECGMKFVTRLTDKDTANLLLPILSPEERYQTYMDRVRLDFGRKIGQGSMVYVSVKGVSKVSLGVVFYKGELSSCNGTMFGVELTVSMLHKLIYKT